MQCVDDSKRQKGHIENDKDKENGDGENISTGVKWTKMCVKPKRWIQHRLCDAAMKNTIAQEGGQKKRNPNYTSNESKRSHWGPI